jgi:hypothetical protein
VGKINMDQGGGMNKKVGNKSSISPSALPLSSLLFASAAAGSATTTYFTVLEK